MINYNCIKLYGIFCYSGVLIVILILLCIIIRLKFGPSLTSGTQVLLWSGDDPMLRRSHDLL